MARHRKDGAGLGPCSDGREPGLDGIRCALPPRGDWRKICPEMKHWVWGAGAAVVTAIAVLMATALVRAAPSPALVQPMPSQRPMHTPDKPTQPPKGSDRISLIGLEQKLLAARRALEKLEGQQQPAGPPRFMRIPPFRDDDPAGPRFVPLLPDDGSAAMDTDRGNANPD